MMMVLMKVLTRGGVPTTITIQMMIYMTEDEFSHLEVQLLSDDGNLYVHHDITLPDFPLSSCQ
jgi:hypothetical protein